MQDESENVSNKIKIGRRNKRHKKYLKTIASRNGQKLYMYSVENTSHLIYVFNNYIIYEIAKNIGT